MFLILLIAWILKVTTPALQQDAAPRQLSTSVREAVANVALGPVPGTFILAGIAIFYGFLVYSYLRRTDDADESGYSEVHV